MSDAVQPPNAGDGERDQAADEPPLVLLNAVVPVVENWLREACLTALHRSGVTPETFQADLDTAIDEAARGLIDRLTELLATDVDEQSTTPLALCRSAVAGPADVLRRNSVPPVLAPESMPADGDEYGLSPAAWSDIHPTLHEPGLTWGAWKAMTILRRRRDEGLR